MTHDDAFLQAISADPDDDTPRLVYADWLDEHGDSARAEFIRVQCRLAQLPGDAPEVPDLREREEQLQSAHGEKWRVALPRLAGVKWSYVFKRGFIASVTFRHGKAFFDHAARLREILPVQNISLGRMTPRTLGQVADSPALARFTGLDASWVHCGAEGSGILARSPHLSRFRSLSLRDVDDEGARSVAAASHWTCLQQLDVMSNRIGPAGVEALANAPQLASLTSLNLYWNPLRNEGVRHLASSPYLTRLRDLRLGGCGIGPDGIQRLVRSPLMENLETLVLTQNVVGAAGAAAFANVSGPPRLLTLWLDNARVGDEEV
jgi:uncharacterized protein (TIGR02996 family)